MALHQFIRSLINRTVLNRGTTAVADWAKPTKSLGMRGEREAERFLLRRGFVIIARQHSDRQGEIDLIAVDNRTVVFVEVKTRKSIRAGHPAEAVDLEKQNKITQTAMRYLRRHNLLENPARFDVIAITWPYHNKKPKIEYFANAFEATGDFQMFS